MLKVGKIEIYDNWNGIINSNNIKYLFRKDDVVFGKVKVGDIVDFVPENYPQENLFGEQKLTARFVKKKELVR